MPPRVPSVAALRALRTCISTSCTSNGYGKPLLSENGACRALEQPTCVLARRGNGYRGVSSYLCKRGSELELPGSFNLTKSIRFACHGSSQSGRYPLPLVTSNLYRRHFSHPTTATSVNAAPRISPAFQKLYFALKALETAAVNYVNLTQLSLALRGLESEDPTVRVAVLSLDSIDSAKRLVRVLLADPLEEEQQWETVLREDDDGTAFLLRYGEELSVDDANPLLRTIQLPSPFLRKHKLELLLHQTDVVSRSGMETNAARKLETLLDLNLAAPSGRSSRMLYPVHKTVVLVSGLSGIQDVFRALEGNAPFHNHILHGAVNVPWQDAAVEPHIPGISLVNVSEAESAIASFRQSLDNAFKYEHGWLNSNMATLLDVLRQGTTPEDSPLKPILQNYIELVLQGTEAAILQEEIDRLSAVASSSLSPTTRDDLLRALSAWAEFAHTELRDELDNALHSRTWHKIAWWKLIWRVDDIGLVMSDMLQRSYLVSAERYLQWVGGYFHAAGLLLADHNPALNPAPRSEPSAAPKGRFGHFPTDNEVVSMVRQDINDAQRLSAPTQLSSATATLNTADDSTVPIPALSPSAPWPQQIATSRNSLLALIPPLQRRAQSIVLRTLSTTGLSTAIGALAYVAVSDTSGYSAGAIAAFGSVWALGAAQKDWNRAKDAWVGQVREEGKRVLEACEYRGRTLIDEKTREGDESMGLGGEGAQERNDAREEVARAREALEDLKGTKKA